MEINECPNRKSVNTAFLMCSLPHDYPHKLHYDAIDGIFWTDKADAEDTSGEQ